MIMATCKDCIHCDAMEEHSNVECYFMIAGEVVV